MILLNAKYVPTTVLEYSSNPQIVSQKISGARIQVGKDTQIINKKGKPYSMLINMKEKNTEEGKNAPGAAILDDPHLE